MPMLSVTWKMSFASDNAHVTLNSHRHSSPGTVRHIHTSYVNEYYPENERPCLKDMALLNSFACSFKHSTELLKLCIYGTVIDDVL